MISELGAYTELELPGLFGERSDSLTRFVTLSSGEEALPKSSMHETIAETTAGRAWQVAVFRRPFDEYVGRPAFLFL